MCVCTHACMRERERERESVCVCRERDPLTLVSTSVQLSSSMGEPPLSPDSSREEEEVERAEEEREGSETVCFIAGCPPGAGWG